MFLQETKLNLENSLRVRKKIWRKVEGIEVGNAQRTSGLMVLWDLNVWSGKIFMAEESFVSLWLINRRNNLRWLTTNMYAPNL